MNTPPCFGKSELFDSVQRDDHRAAKIHCLGRRRPDGSQITPPCPFLAGCKRTLDAAREEFGIPHGPEGTWAGLLVTAAGGVSADATRDRDPKRIALEEATYTDEEAKLARAMASRGDRSPWVVAGVRTYERRRRTAKRAAEKAAAA
jgi:hypothetical protein